MDSERPKPFQWTPAALRRFWAWERTFPEHYFSAKYGPAIAQVLRRYVRAGHRVLDYGCGIGFLSALLVRRFRVEVWATDEDAESVRLTRDRNASHARFRQAAPVDELLELRIWFNRVVAVELLEHLDDAQTDLFFYRVSQMLSPGGLLIVTTPNREQLDRKIVLCPNCDHTFHRWQHLRSVSRDTLAQLGAERGFRLTTAVETDFARRGVSGYLLRRFATGFAARDANRPHLVGVYERQPGAAAPNVGSAM